MGRISRLSDQELDRLLAGKVASGNGDLEELAAFIRDVRGRFGEPPSAETAARHLAAIVEAAHFTGEGEETTARQEREGSAADRERSGQPRSRRKLMLRNPFSPLRAKLAVAVTAVGLLLLSAFGGVAYAGALPDPVQGAVADVAGTIGISLPGSGENDLDEGNVDDVDDGNVGDLDDGDVDNVDDGAVDDLDEGELNDLHDGDVGDVDEGDQGNVEESDQGNADEGDQGNVENGTQSDGQGNENSGGGQSGDQGGNGSQGNGNN